MTTKPIHLVLVEDDVDLARVMEEALKEEGLAVELAHDGRAGLELIDRVHPDVVVTDLVMPVLDGLQLIRQLLVRSGPPVIAISAVGSRLHAARELGAVEALVKPVHPRELAECARKATRPTAVSR
jgi:DNA-binding response OmpR family regulator